MALTIKAMIAKRRERWESLHDMAYDRKLTEAAVKEILQNKELRAIVTRKPYLLIEVSFSIVDKQKRTVPFFLNEVQRDFLCQLEQRGTDKPYFILKGRQQGFTTLITAIQLAYSVVQRNFSGFTIAHRRDSTKAIFNDKARMVYHRLPERLKPHEKYNSADELFFDRLNSSWRVETASEDVARGMTLNFVHLSEAAFYSCDFSLLQASVGEAAAAGAVVIYETTANGFNHAKELWDSGACHTLFYGWWRTAEYRRDEAPPTEAVDAWLAERLRLLAEQGLDEAQRNWYAHKYASYLDKSLIKQEYPCTPEEAFLSGGECMFDKEAILSWLLRLEKKPAERTGYFTYKKTGREIRNSAGETADMEWSLTDIAFVEDKNGYITLHEEPCIKKNGEGQTVALAPYTLGGDTAGSGTDYFTGKVVCSLDRKTAATLRKQRMDEDLYAEQMYCLGKYYHDALIGIETNYSRQPTRLLASVYRYPHLYLRERLDRLCETVEQVPGFETTAKTKPVIIGELVAAMREDVTLECDRETLREMTVFVKKENGRMEATRGMHDDLVMALAIAHFIGTQQRRTWIPVDTGEKDFIARNFSDESNAGAFMTW